MSSFFPSIPRSGCGFGASGSCQVAWCSTWLLALLMLFGGRSAAQTAPRLLPFQGRLTDQNGVAVSNGVRLVQFKIYDVPTGGSSVWAGEVHKATVNAGLVNLVLGSKTPFTGVDFDKTLYLEITVDINGDSAITVADPPMLPRQIILPAVFAKESADSRLLAGRNWMPIFGTNSPDGPIPATKLAPGSITAVQVAPHTLTSNQIAPGSIGAMEIGSNAVTAAQIAPGTITSNNFALAQIHSGLLAQNAVGTSNLMDGAVTLPKMAPRAVQTGTAGVGAIAVSETSGNTSDISKLTVTITTSGRPVFVGLVAAPNGVNTSYFGVHLPINGYASGAVQISRETNTVAIYDLVGSSVNGGSYNYVPSSAVHALDAPLAPGTYTYTVSVTGPHTVIYESRLIAYEL